jgi:hypothetical protein
MVYNNWQGSPALTTEPSFARQIGAQNQSPMHMGNNEPWSTTNSVHSTGTLHMGNPDARFHQLDSVNHDQKLNAFSKVNSQPNNHPGNYEDIYIMQRPPVRPEQQQIPNNFNNQPRIQGQNSNGFPNKNLSNMIMQENNDNWQLQQAQMPSKIKQQTSNDSLNESRRGGRREGPISMLRSPPRNGREEEPIHPPQPIMTNFKKNNEIGQSPQVFMTPKSIPGSPPIAGQSGPNKFAPLVQKQMPKPPQSTGFQSNQRANSNQPPSKAHEFFSNDPMLRNMANQYY